MKTSDTSVQQVERLILCIRNLLQIYGEKSLFIQRKLLTEDRPVYLVRVVYMDRPVYLNKCVYMEKLPT